MRGHSRGAGKYGIQPVKEDLYQRHITARAVSEVVGMTPQNVTITLNGYVMPSLKTAARIARMVEKPIEECYTPELLGIVPSGDAE